MLKEQNSNVIRPVAGGNAIVNVSFGFEWRERISQGLFAKFSALHSEVEDYLPVKREFRQQVFVEVVGEQPSASDEAHQQAQITMITMDYVENGMLVRQVVASENKIAFNDFGAYDGWSAVRARAIRCLWPLVEAALTESQLAVVGLQYLDAFEIVGDAPVAPDVFVHNELLPAHVFERVEPWHVQQGYFTDTARPIPFHNLTHVNTKLIGLDGKKILELQTSHRAIFDGETCVADQDTILTLQDELHDDNKMILCKMLLPDIKIMIGLEKEEA